MFGESSASSGSDNGEGDEKKTDCEGDEIMTNGNNGEKLNGYGGNIGVNAGLLFYFLYTISFSPMSRDFGSHPGSRR
jgi:hypothetical protein